MSAVRVRGLQRHFGHVAAVDGLDLDVASGAVLAVLGPSGCGKTTLLRLLAGFLAPTAGTIEIEGRAVAGPGVSVAPEKRRLGLVPQEGALFPHLDVAANLGFGLARGERTPARIAELLDLVELPADTATRRPAELSGGQQQRVAVARALAPAPAVLLLDEPFSSLDSGLRVATGHAVVRAIRDSGSTAVLVTHDQGEALSLADDVAVMQAGRIVQHGPPAEIYAAPASAFVAGFVGDGTVIPAHWDNGMARCAAGEVPVATTGPGAGSLLLRPEQVEIVPDPDGLVVAAVDFHGHDAVVRIALPGEATALLARVRPADLPRPGDRVAVTLRGPASTYSEGPA